MAQVFKKPVNRLVDKLQQDIGALAEGVRSRVQATKRTAEEHIPKSRKRVRFEPDTPDLNTNQECQRLTPADNPYAREIFMCKTNVRDIAKEIVESQKKYDSAKKDQMVKSFRDKLYRFYANEPKYRIRDPLYKLRFESCYYEYRFYLALNKPLSSEEDYQEYLAQLTVAGVGECWVRMKDENLLLKHEEAVVAQVRKKIGTNWSGKLEKLETYLIDSQRRYEARRKEVCKKTKKISTSPNTSVEENQLLDKIMYHSNAIRRFSERQILQLFPDIKHELERAEFVIFYWLLFNDDELNKRYKLGNYKSQLASTSALVPVNSFRGTPDSDRSIDSECSEFRQMRSEMAMTQPSEVLPIDGSYFANTVDVIGVLDPIVNLPEEIIQPVDVQSLEQPALENSVPTETENSSMLTPAQQEVILITDSPPRPSVDSTEQSNVKEGDIFYSLEYLRNFTNVQAVVADGLKRRFKGQQLENKMTQIDKYVARYHDRNQHILAQNKLPEGLRLLTRKERKEKLGKENVDERVGVEEERVVINSPVAQSLEKNVEKRYTVIPHVDTPIVRTVTVRARAIQYDDEDDSPAQVPQVLDSMPMPDTENFMPSDCSTQIPFDGPTISRSATPFPSPVRPNTSFVSAPRSPILNNGCNTSPKSQQQQPLPRSTSTGPSILSRSSTADPAYDSDVSNVTVLSNKNIKSPEKSPRIKIELNSTNYEGEVEFVPTVNQTIEIDDSMGESSQIDANELIERHAQRGKTEDSVMFGVPAVLQGMVNALFQENKDTTLSQGSSSGSDSRNGPPGVGTTSPQDSGAVGFRENAVAIVRRSST